MNKNILKPYNILSNHSLKCLYNLSCPWVYYKNAHFSILLPSAIILYIQRCCQFFKFKKIIYTSLLVFATVFLLQVKENLSFTAVY